MADFLNLNGWNVPVARGSASGDYENQGTNKRTITGVMLSSSRALKGSWQFETIPLTREQVRGLVGLVSGQGDLWKFDASLWSEKGIGATSNSNALAGASTGGRFGTGVNIVNPNVLSYPSHVFNPLEGTVTAWVFVNSEVRGGADSRVFWHGSNNANANIVSLTNKFSGEWHFTIGDFNNFQSIYIPASFTENDAWYHFAVRWNDAEYAIFLNGVKRASGTVANQPTARGATLDFGHFRGTEQLGSNLDSVQVLPYPASTEQIAALAAAGGDFPAQPMMRASGNAMLNGAKTVIGEVENVEWVSDKTATVSFRLHER